MINIIIKNKGYHSYNTAIDGRTIVIPPKGQELPIQVTEITEHLLELERKNKIQILKK